jgi:hypothetical protein
MWLTKPHTEEEEQVAHTEEEEEREPLHLLYY